MVINRAKHNYHISPTGEVGICRAVSRPCPWAEATSIQMASKLNAYGETKSAEHSREDSQRAYEEMLRKYGSSRFQPYPTDPHSDPLTTFVELQESAGGIQNAKSFTVVLDTFDDGNYTNEIRLDHSFVINHLGQLENVTNVRAYRWRHDAKHHSVIDMPKHIDHIMENGGHLHYEGLDKPKTDQFGIVQDVQLYVTPHSELDGIDSNNPAFDASMTQAEEALTDFYAAVAPNRNSVYEATVKAKLVADIFKTIEINSRPMKVWQDQLEIPADQRTNPFRKIEDLHGENFSVDVVLGEEELTETAVNDMLYRRSLDAPEPKFSFSMDNTVGRDMFQKNDTQPAKPTESGIGWSLSYDEDQTWKFTVVDGDGYSKTHDIGANGYGLFAAAQEFNNDPLQLGGRASGVSTEKVHPAMREYMGSNNYELNIDNAEKFINTMNAAMQKHPAEHARLVARRTEIQQKQAEQNFMQQSAAGQFTQGTPIAQQYLGTGVSSSNQADEAQQLKKKQGFMNSLNKLFG